MELMVGGPTTRRLGVIGVLPVELLTALLLVGLGALLLSQTGLRSIGMCKGLQVRACHMVVKGLASVKGIRHLEATGESAVRFLVIGNRCCLDGLFLAGLSN